MKKIITTVSIFFILIITAKAQFYNGLQMNFGKNRVQYKNFEWRYYSYKNYDIFFYDRDKNLGKFVAKNINGIIDEMENFFGIVLEDRMEIIVYANITDFRQTNGGLETENADFNVGGKYQIVNDKIFLYYEGTHKDFTLQLRKLLAKVYIKQILYGSAFSELLSSSTAINLPDWFESGLASYAADPYNSDVFNKTKAFIESHKHFSFNRLTGEEAEYLGHSFWFYIASTFGKTTIANILYFIKISKSLTRSISYVTGTSLNQLTKQWLDYYKSRFENNNFTTPPKDKKVLQTRKKRIFTQFALSPDGKRIAYVENNRGKYKIYLYDEEQGKSKVIYKGGERLDQIIDYSYPVLTWNRRGDMLAFTTETKGNVYMHIYNFNDKTEKKGILQNIDKVLSMSFSPQNVFIVLSGISNGYTDLFIYNRLSGTSFRLTYDLADDIDPHFTKDGRKIIFASNRTSDTLERMPYFQKNPPLGNNFNLFVYDYYTKSPVLTQITKDSLADEIQPIPVEDNKYLYLSEKYGFWNKYEVEYDSIIGFVDTTVHYRYFSTVKQITNYPQSIIKHDLANNTAGDLILQGKKFQIYKYPANSILENNLKGDELFFKKLQNEEIIQKQQLEAEKERQRQEKLKLIDSLTPTFEAKINSADTSFVDINNYIFEVEKDSMFGEYYKKLNEEEKTPYKKPLFPQMRVYQPLFFMEDVMGQIDFSMLNQSYQPFTGDAFKFNNGMTYFTSVTLRELMEDYRLIGGIRFGFNGSIEYLFSIENLKKRLDKQIIFHRQRIKYATDNYFWPAQINKTITNELMFVLRYPFSQTTSIKTTFIGKYDDIMPLSTEYNTLIAEDTLHIYSGFKTEYIFDNTRELSLNLLDGIRYKIFGEIYQQVQGNYDYTAVLGADFRFYKNIFRHFIIAQRFAGATSFGSGKVIFYLGGVDNWINLYLAPNAYFDHRVNINYDQNYIFQAVATNMRGFPQNIRNGNTFVVSNTELRLPVTQMIFSYPINSGFWYNLQVIGFFDIGSAWAGKSPNDPKNLYNELRTVRPPFTVIVEVDRPPFVYSYGWGLRTKVMGYFVRLDFAHGIEARYHYPMKMCISLSKDF